MAEKMLAPEHRASPVPELLPTKKSQPKRTCEDSSGIGIQPAYNNETTATKRVVIKMPPKRQKVAPVTPKQVIEGISTSVSQQERIEALSEASLSFDHSIQSAHDDELADGAASVLTKHLAFLLFRKYHLPNAPNSSTTTATTMQGSSSNDTADVPLSTEISRTLEILEMVFRATVNAVSDAFASVGYELLPLLLTIIDKEIDNRNERNKEKAADMEKQQIENELIRAPTTNGVKYGGGIVQTQGSMDNQEDSRPVTPTEEVNDAKTRIDGDFSLQKATKILGHFARVSDVTQPMAFHSGLLPSLIRITSFVPYSGIPSEARLNSLWVIANLACNTDNMLMMFCHPGLIYTLIMGLRRTVTDDDSAPLIIEVVRSYSIASRALHNLSWAPENKIPMAENSMLVEALTKMAVLRSLPNGCRMRGCSSILLQTRSHALGALRNLASAPRRTKICLCEYENGAVLDALTDAAMNDIDQDARDKALSTIHNLAIHDTAEMMFKRSDLRTVLRDVMLKADDLNGINVTPSKKITAEQRKADASATLLVLQRTINENHKDYQELKKYLDSIYPPSEDLMNHQSGAEPATCGVTI